MSNTNTKRRRRILGLPVPVVAALMALTVGGVAWAAILFYGRATVEREINKLPSVQWSYAWAGNQDGADVTIQSGKSGNETDTLKVKVTGYPGGTVDLAARVTLQDPPTPSKVMITDATLGEGLDVELLGGELPSAVPGMPSMGTYYNNVPFVSPGEQISTVVSGQVAVLVRLHITIPEDATPGTFAAENVAALTFAIADQ